MWELDCEESWALKNWCFWTVVLEKTLESPLDCKQIQPVHSKRDQFRVFIGRTDAKAETPILCPVHAKSWLIGKESDAERDWVQEEKGTTEDEMAGWHHRLDGHEFEWTPGVGDGQGGLACYDSWGCKESDTTERLNWTELPPAGIMLNALHTASASGAQSCCVWLSAAPWTVVCQAPLSVEFSKQERILSGLPFPTPGDLSDPGIQPLSLASPASAGRFFTTSATWEASQLVFHKTLWFSYKINATGMKHTMCKYSQ